MFRSDRSCALVHNMSDRLAKFARRASLLRGVGRRWAPGRKGGFVTSPFSDGTVPTIDAPPMPVSPHGELTRLRSERAQWERRAAVAADAVAELDTALLTLNRAVKGNYFGDCVEGLGVYEGLRRAISSLSDEISSRSDRANRLASQCRLAASEIESADTEGAAGF